MPANHTATDALPTLESVLCTEELNRRPTRPPDYATENRALLALSRALSNSSDTILQTLTDTILDVFQCGSAGISLLTPDETRFHWPAIAGMWNHHVGGGTPRDFGPCGDVLDRNAALLFQHPERRYTYFAPVTPAVRECLLVPFYLAGKAVGTIWAIVHEGQPDARRFDREDQRMLESLATFASAAYHAVGRIQELQEHAKARGEASRAMRQMNEALMKSGIRQHELTETSEALGTRLQAAVKEKEYFIAVLSHELRTPLTPVLIAASVLRQDRRLESETRAIIDMIHRNVTLEARLIDDLLDMTRMEHGKVQLDRRPVELREVVEHAVEVCRADVEAGGLTLRVDLGAKPQIIDADAGRLQQVFSNLLRNAIKFSPTGGDIGVRSNCDGESCTVEVSDSGAGIDSEFLPRIFSAFEQGDRSTSRKAGLGLGLAICKTIVDLHGGTITAQSAGKDQGATFIVRLPAMVGVLAVPAETEPAPSDRLHPAKPLRILLVEDHADTAHVMRWLLKAEGHTVQWAADIAAGLKLAASQEFDLLLSDLGLPDGTGVDLMHSLRQQGSTLPGIVLSGYGQDQDIARSRQAGFAAHLVKPVSAGKLRETIVTLIG